MPRFAILKNNVVQNLIVCDTLEEAQTVGDAVLCANRRYVMIDAVYDPETGKFNTEVDHPPIVREE